MRNVTLAAMALTAAMSTRARANYAWEFDVTKAVPGYYNFGPFPPYGFVPDTTIPPRVAKSWIPEFGFSITDQAFASHALNVGWSSCYAGAGSCQIPPHGDLTGLVSFTGGDLTPPGGWGSGLISLNFNKHGKLDGDIELFGDVDDLVLSSGDNRLWTGWYASDANECGVEVQRCDLTGRWKFLGHSSSDHPSVPEPASWALLGMGLLGAGAARRRSLIC